MERIRKVSFVDLKIQLNEIKKEIESAFWNILDESRLILGPQVEMFEKEFADFCKTKYCVGVNSGTSGLYLSLLACNVGEKDEVITVPNSFIATAIAISQAGAKPVFVDVDENSFNIDVNKIEEKITSKTRVIIPVHLFGQAANMDEILSIAKKYKLKVIEDACQAHGAEYKDKKVGSIGDIGCFSFYPTKNLGAYGDSGAVVTDNKEIFEKLLQLRNYGEKKKYYHESIGFNERLDSMQAAFLRVKLKYLDKWNEKRRSNAKMYNKLLRNSDVILPKELPNVKHVYHLYVIRTNRRDALKNYLNEKGILTVIHYPVPIHLQYVYKDLKLGHGTYPVTEKLAKEILSLPMYPELSREEIKYVTDTIMDFDHNSIL